MDRDEVEFRVREPRARRRRTTTTMTDDDHHQISPWNSGGASQRVQTAPTYIYIQFDTNHFPQCRDHRAPVFIVRHVLQQQVHEQHEAERPEDTSRFEAAQVLEVLQDDAGEIRDDCTERQPVPLVHEVVAESAEPNLKPEFSHNVVNQNFRVSYGKLPCVQTGRVEGTADGICNIPRSTSKSIGFSGI